MKHYFVSRAAIDYNEPRLKKPFTQWAIERSKMYNDYVRTSLKDQTVNNFELITVVDKDHEHLFREGVLENEVIIPMKRMDGFNREVFLNSIKVYINLHCRKNENIIISRIDSDDMLPRNYAELIQKYIKPGEYLDIYKLIVFDSINNKIYDSPKYHNMISPFVSVMDKCKQLKITNYQYDHTMIGLYMKGQKIDKLYAVQVIHEENL
ncbi:MAG: hypothetical protein J7L15_04250, partial [Clostridiales bacterium]|nr:hypothetical protein [Clostridiales bacterium]